MAKKPEELFLGGNAIPENVEVVGVVGVFIL
jgi:hypothetical protein